MSKEVAFVKEEKHGLTGNYAVPQHILDEIEKIGEESSPIEGRKTIYDRESDYHRRKYNRTLEDNKPYNEVMEQRQKEREEGPVDKEEPPLKKSRWDDQTEEESGYYVMPEMTVTETAPTEVPGLNVELKNNDVEFFGDLLDGREDDSLTPEELKEREVLRLVLKVKNGTTQMRKASMKQLTENAVRYGPQMFDRILPILLDKSLEDQDRHLLMKIIDRALRQLKDAVRPYTHKLLVVVSPLLIEEDYVTRQTGREIISQLAKAAGLANMISNIRPDIDHADEYVRNTTSRALAVVAKALGLAQVIPFLKAVCRSKKTWQARHTGIKTIQQIAILMGVGCLPHLNALVGCITDCLHDENMAVRNMTANAIAALAQAAHPYGIEAFEVALEPLWKGVKTHRGKSLAAFLRALGYIIPLMDPEYSSYYTNEVMYIIQREMSSPDEEMKKCVLQVIQQCPLTVTAVNSLLPPFFRHFWMRRVALDRQLSKLVVQTTLKLSSAGVGRVMDNLLTPLKDESEPFRTMAVLAVDKVITQGGTAEINDRAEALLVDSLLVAFQHQTKYILACWKTVSSSLNVRMKPYLANIISTLLHRLKHKDPEIRLQAADLVAVLTPVLFSCQEMETLNKLSVILYESLGEAYPEVLGSLISALDAIVQSVGVKEVQPPVNQLLPTLTPILRNTHRKVQEATIQLVGRIADNGPEYVSPREWMRICAVLLDMLKSQHKSVRRAANTTFGYIARAVGPQEVIVVLLSNLRMQERQPRVCTAVAIGITAETCSPFTVLPAMMNEYRTPDIHVQNGVLKAMTFMFEYIGEMARDYIYAVTPLLEDALTDRDLVHRQTAATVTRHLALGCAGLGCEDAFIHLLNLIIPNIYETSPHVVDRIMESLDALRMTVGTGIFMNYIWNGLFHAARHVRKPYWRVYNGVYVGACDSLVPYYPVLEEEPYKLDILDDVL